MRCSPLSCLCAWREGLGLCANYGRLLSGRGVRPRAGCGDVVVLDLAPLAAAQAIPRGRPRDVGLVPVGRDSGSTAIRKLLVVF